MRNGTKMVKSRGRPRKFDTQAVLNKAMMVFWQRGLAATSLDDLADAMGMNRPSIYNAFGNKENIYRQAITQFCNLLDQGVKESLEADPDLHQGLLGFYAQALNVYYSDDPAMGCFVMCTAPTEALAHPDVRNDLHEIISSVDKRIEERLKQAIKTGQLNVICDPHLMAKLVQGTLHSLAIRARAGESKTQLLEMADYFVQILLKTNSTLS